MSEELRTNPFDGVMSKYKEWSANVTNHLLQCNQGWGRILWLAQKEKEPITYYRLQIAHLEGLPADCVWLSRALYAFLYEHVSAIVKKSMPRRVEGGQEYNGLEWQLNMQVEQ